jgi:putative ABC transport system permease protein
MFNLDRWREILDTLMRSKLRTLLTAFSMAWGIFMLVVLLGLGNGLQHGIEQQFADDAVNSIWIRGGATSLPWQGLPNGRRVVFSNTDVDTVRAMPESDKVTGRFYVGGSRFQSQLTVRVGKKSQSYDVRSVHPDHLYLENTIMKQGRFLNEPDITDRRKVCVIGAPVAKFLFEDKDAVGEYVELGGGSFKVVGVFDDTGEQGEAQMIYIPISTAQAMYNGNDKVNQVMFTLQPDVSVDESVVLAQHAKDLLARAHRFDPHDPQAVWVRNNAENYRSFLQIFQMISIFVTFMAACTLLAGVIGISNIMMIVVRERTREIGVRKALGATAVNIVTSIVQESVALTAVAGYCGMCAGIGLLALIDKIVPPGNGFADPSVSLTVALVATGVLIIAGALAGLFPALAAAKVNPIVALRDE